MEIVRKLIGDRKLGLEELLGGRKIRILEIEHY